MKKIKAIVLCMLAMLISIYSLGEANQIDKVVEKSSNLSSFQATIAMTKFSKKGNSNIKFKIKWIYPDKMKIIYLAPKRVKGQVIIVNQNRFYSYIPTLNREINKKVSKGSNKTGKEMGFLYEFLNRSADTFTENYRLELLKGPKVKKIETGSGSISYKIYMAKFKKGNLSQIVQFTVSTYIPVSVEIFEDGERQVSLKVLEYKYNTSIPATEFKIPPEK